MSGDLDGGHGCTRWHDSGVTGTEFSPGSASRKPIGAAGARR